MVHSKLKNRAFLYNTFECQIQESMLGPDVPYESLPKSAIPVQIRLVGYAYDARDFETALFRLDTVTRKFDG